MVTCPLYSILPLDAPVQLPSCSRLSIMGVTTHHFILHVLCMLPNVTTAGFRWPALQVSECWRMCVRHVWRVRRVHDNDCERMELTRRGAGDARHRVQRWPLPCELPLATRCLCNSFRLHRMSCLADCMCGARIRLCVNACAWCLCAHSQHTVKGICTASYMADWESLAASKQRWGVL